MRIASKNHPASIKSQEAIARDQVINAKTHQQQHQQSIKKYGTKIQGNKGCKQDHTKMSSKIWSGNFHINIFFFRN